MYILLQTPPLRNTGFSLVQVSIVLVIIGLLLGGILVGQGLIQTAAVNAQISQIDKYNTAVNIFQTKYNGYLPGDIPASIAAKYGFTARGGQQARGDGNGIVEGIDYLNNTVYDWGENGETLFFWEDLSQAGLIEGKFNSFADADTSCATPAACTAYLPSAKIGGGNFVYIYSGLASTCCGSGARLTPNLFGISVISAIWSSYVVPVAGLTVAQAYNIDKKIDDGSPVTGNVLAQYVSGPGGTYPSGGTSSNINWATNAASGSATTCFDTSSGTAAYSITQNNGNGLNCGLSFQLQTQ